jgi:hypothetical protein
MIHARTHKQTQSMHVHISDGNLAMKRKTSFNRIALRSIPFALAACGYLHVGTAAAQSGEFTYIFGTVTVESGGQRVQATRGLKVNPGDLVVTGANGLAQLTMVDNARLALRTNSQLRVERYARSASDTEGAVLSLVRGTLRTFTSLLSSASRDRYQMKTRVATVGIRGSGNILQHSDDGVPTTVNHTIEGSHDVRSNEGNFPSIITTPNDTIRVVQGRAPERIPTPPGLIESVTGYGGGAEEESESLPPLALDSRSGVVGSNGLGFTFVDDKAGVVGSDPIALRDVVVSGGGATFSNQATETGLTLDGRSLRGYRGYEGSQSGASVAINGGTAADVSTVNLNDGTVITLGRWNNADGLTISGQTFRTSGSVHWAYANSGFPTYLSDVLTGTVSYQRVGATTPTNQFNTLGQLVTTVLDVNFTARTLNATIGVSMPANAATPAGSWTLQATNIAFALNGFSASTGSGVVVTNGSGTSSATNPNLTGSIEGSFVGRALNGAIVGYQIGDRTAQSTNAWNIINGVVVFQGPSQNAGAQYRDGLVSDPANSLANASFIRSFATTNRPSEVTVDANGRATAFAAPVVRGNNLVGHQSYAVGSANVVDAGFDPSTGLVWGRWSGGNASVAGQNVSLANASLHYIYSPVQSGPVTLPLTGTASYEVVGSTRPTDLQGNVGTLNSATLNANFSARTVDTSVNLTVANQTWNASANGVPIYRNQYFSATTGSVPGLPRPAQLLISCSPNCTPAIPTGSIDGFFTGRTGQGAGVMYNVNNISGAVAFRRK